MNEKQLTIGFALTGSFCTISSVIPEIKKLAAMGHSIIPIISQAVDQLDTRFYKAATIKNLLLDITGNEIIRSISDAEPIGPKKLLDALIVAPCSGNTLAKIANGINDTPVTMAVKSHLRNKRPVVLAISTNDGLAASAEPLGKLLNRKNIYFVPFHQDDPIEKQNSLVARNDLIIPTLTNALKGVQTQPLLWSPHNNETA